MKEIEKEAINTPTKFDPWKITAILCVLLSAYLMISPRMDAPAKEPVNLVESVKKPTIDSITMQEAKATYKPKSIRENLARAKEVMAGFKEKKDEEPMDRMKRFNDYVLEATKEDVKVSR